MPTTRVDDRDPSISYSGSWLLGGVPEEYNGTTHGTFVPGAAWTFSFYGTSITVFGSVEPNITVPIISTYTLDRLPSESFSAPNTSMEQRPFVFFQSSVLPVGEHTLVTTVSSCAIDNYYWFDFLTYDTATAPAADSIPKTTSSSSLSLSSSQSVSASSLPTIPATPSVSSPKLRLTSSLPTTSESFATSTIGTSSSPSLTTSTISIATATPQNTKDSAVKLGVLIPAVVAPVCGTIALLAVSFLAWRTCRGRRRGQSRETAQVSFVPDAFTEYQPCASESSPSTPRLFASKVTRGRLGSRTDVESTPPESTVSETSAGGVAQSNVAAYGHVSDHDTGDTIEDHGSELPPSYSSLRKAARNMS